MYWKNRFPRILGGAAMVLISALALSGAGACVLAAAAEEPADPKAMEHDHSGQESAHQAMEHEHSAHMGAADAMEHDHTAQEHAGHAAGDDPHAHHRAMMQQSGYQRSEHDYPLRDVPLVDMHGKKTTLLAELDVGKPVMVNFIFTTCTTICPVMSATFQQVQAQLGAESDQVRMISFSIDPEHDTPKRLHEYAMLFEAGDQWQFLTGSLANSVAVQKAFGVYRGNKMSHEPTTLLRKSPGDPWIRIDGLASARDIVKEYQQLSSR